MSTQNLMKVTYYDQERSIRLTGYADTVVWDEQPRPLLAALRFGGYPEAVRGLSDAIYGGANKTAEVALPQNKRLQCHFRDLTGAAYYADRKKGLTDWQSKERFRAALSGRGVTQSHWPKI